MKTVLFDPMGTLVHEGELIPGAREALSAIRAIRSEDGDPVVLALAPPKGERLNGNETSPVLERLGLSEFFDLAARQAVDEYHTHDTILITTDESRVTEAHEVGMAAAYFRPLGGDGDGSISSFEELVATVARQLAYVACGKSAVAKKQLELYQLPPSEEIDEEIEQIAAQVDPASLYDFVKELTDLDTRFSFSPNIGSVTGWVHEKFDAMGHTQIESQPFKIAGSPSSQQNILCRIGSKTDPFVLVCAHYDSRSETPMASAPGADDNASGVAALLESARLLKDVPLGRGVLFAAFGGEEQGLHGSQECAKIAAADGWQIDVVINLDMISYKAPGGAPGITVEFDQGNAVPGNDTASKGYARVMAQAGVDYTSLKIFHANIERSDYMPFEKRGYPCIGVYNAVDNPDYHTTRDTIDKIDFAHLAEVTKMIVATVVTVARS